MHSVNLNDPPLHLHDWAELDHIAALEHEAAARQGRKLTAADLDAADARRAEARRWMDDACAALQGRRVPASAHPWPVRLWRRIARTARIAWLHWTISSNEQWLRVESRRRAGRAAMSHPTLRRVLRAVSDGAPHCVGNCAQGRRPCTLPGVCSLSQRCRSQRHARPHTSSIALAADAHDDLSRADARLTRNLLLIYIIAAVSIATALLI